jgi:hypothetical protein
LLQLANPCVANQFTGKPESFIATLLAAGLQNSTGSRGSLDEVFSLIDCQRQRLFAVDILAGPHGGDRDQRVPVVNGTADYNVNILAFGNSSKIFVRFRIWPEFLGFSDLAIVDVAHRDYLAEAGCRLGVSSPASAAAY